MRERTAAVPSPRTRHRTQVDAALPNMSGRCDCGDTMPSNEDCRTKVTRHPRPVATRCNQGDIHSVRPKRLVNLDSMPGAQHRPAPLDFTKIGMMVLVL